MTVEDDGSGFDTGDAPVGTGLGTRIVDAIARSLGTTVQAIDKTGGTALRLSVKSGR